MSDRAKAVVFRGRALDDLRAFPRDARQAAGHQIDRIQQGYEADDWKPMATVGSGVREIRIRDTDGAFRVIYLARFADAIFVLHCFRKTTQKTSRSDLAIAKQRYAQLIEEIGR